MMSTDPHHEGRHSCNSSRRSVVLGAAALPFLVACGALPKKGHTAAMTNPESNDDARSMDVAIVGGSFAGLSAAYQLARASRTIAIFDTGLPRNRFACGTYGVLGHDGTSPLALRDMARAQLAAYPTASFIDTGVTGISLEGEGFRLEASGSPAFTAKRVILSYGLKDILPNRSGFKEGWGQSVLQCPYCHGYEVRQQRFGLLYTSEASLHQIRIMRDWSQDIVFFGDGNVIPDDAIAEMKARNIRFEPGPVRALHVVDRQLRSVMLESGYTVDRDALFLITANEPTTDLAEQLGCAMEEGPFGRYIVTDNLQETSVPGVYAAGDVSRPIHNLTWASSSGVSAGIFCHQSLLAHKNPYFKG